MKRYKSRTEFVIEAINRYRPDKNCKYIDIGFVGEYDTPFLHYEILKTLKEDDFMVGVDINPKVKELVNDDFIKKYINQSEYKVDDVFNLKETSLDVVTLLEVFEHLPHPYLALTQISKNMNKGGVFIMTYPNPLSIKIFLRYIFTRNILDNQFLTKYRGHHEHKIFPMPPSVINYMQDFGLEVVEIAYLKGKLSKIPFLNKFSDYIGIVARKV